MEPIGVKIIRAEKRGRKIIIVFESDLYSKEVFAVNPFYDEGDAKNQLQDVKFNLEVKEEDGNVFASVGFFGSGSHFTTGHTQIHHPMDGYFLGKKDCARHWAMTEQEKYINEGDRVEKALKMWEGDEAFIKELTSLILSRKEFFLRERFKKAKENYKIALKELEEAMDLEVK